MNQNWSALKAFEQGRHQQVVERVQLPTTNSSELMALIGSLSFLGRVEEAKELWTVSSDRLSVQQKVRARFALGLALTRVSKYGFAKKLFRESLLDPTCRKFADTFQGAGIYYYYLGKFHKARHMAEESLRLSLELGDAYMRPLATDLLGHSLCQLGRLSRGLQLLEQAKELAQGSSQSEAISIEQLCYEAKFGFRPKTILAELEAALAKCSAENSYSKINLNLELARQLTLRGRWSQARLTLDQIAPTIYSFENRRQELTLQLHLAEIAFLQGDVASLIYFINAAKRSLHRVGDRAYELKILGIEIKATRVLQGNDPSEEMLARFEALAQRFPGLVSRNILYRWSQEARQKSMPVKRPAPLDDRESKTQDLEPSTEDLLGDLLNRIATDREKGQIELLNKGYLGLWPGVVARKASNECLLVYQNGRWISLRRRGVVDGGEMLFTQLQMKLLRALKSAEVVSKEQLLAQAWGYAYDPLRHDQMIYSALGNLRRTLGSEADWLQTHDNGWAIGSCEFIPEIFGSSERNLNFPDGKFVKDAQQFKTNVTPVPETQLLKETGNISSNQTSALIEDSREFLALNWRQARAVSEREAWTPRQYREEFQISPMTAWRDLDELVEMRYFTKRGHGRLTMYQRRSK